MVVLFSPFERLNDVEECARPSTHTWVYGWQDKATTFHKHTNCNMEEKGLERDVQKARTAK